MALSGRSLPCTGSTRALAMASVAPLPPRLTLSATMMGYAWFRVDPEGVRNAEQACPRGDISNPVWSWESGV